MKHSDCKNFTPLDAFKGLCRANGGMVMIDSDTCPAVCGGAEMPELCSFL